MKCYEENIGLLTPAAAELLFSFEDDLNELMIIQAIKIAAQRNNRHAKYIAGILNNWIKKGYKTLADIEEEKSNSKKEETEEERLARQTKELEELVAKEDAEKNANW